MRGQKGEVHELACLALKGARGSVTGPERRRIKDQESRRMGIKKAAHSEETSAV